MKNPAVEIQPSSVNDIFTSLKEIIREVAPLKVVDEIKLEDSLVEDYAFDSIDMMQLLLKVRERLLADKDGTMDIDVFLQEAYNDCEGKPVTIKNMCQLIANYA